MATAFVGRKIDVALEAATKVKVAKEKEESENLKSEETSMISTTNVEDINEQPPVRTTAQRREEGSTGHFFEGFAQGT